MAANDWAERFFGEESAAALVVVMQGSGPDMICNSQPLPTTRLLEMKTSSLQPLRRWAARPVATTSDPLADSYLSPY
jgi:hypothetical protein